MHLWIASRPHPSSLAASPPSKQFALEVFSAAAARYSPVCFATLERMINPKQERKNKAEVTTIELHYLHSILGISLLIVQGTDLGTLAITRTLGNLF